MAGSQNEHVAEECKWTWLVDGFKYDLETETKPNTVAYYLHHVTAFVCWAKNAGNVPDPEQLSKRHIQGFFHDLLTEPLVATTGNGANRRIVRSERTRWPYYRSLKRFFGWAEKEGFLKQNPLDQMRLRQPVAPPIEPYRPEHLRRMLEILDVAWRSASTPRQRMLAARTKAMLLLFLESGLRLAELAALTVHDVDIPGQRVIVRHGKMGKGRYTGFGGDTKKALWRYMGLRDGIFPETRALWLGEEGQPLSAGIYNQ